MFDQASGISTPATDFSSGPSGRTSAKGGPEKSASTALRARISSTGFYAPPRVETAAELAPRMGTTEEWILGRTGVRERRVSDEPVEVMAARAARAALGSGDAPDLILFAAASGRQLIPDTSVFVQRELGLDGIPCHSVQASCISFVVALHEASALVHAGAYRRILVVSAERGTVGRNMTEPESAALLGDGAAAAIVEPPAEGEASALIGWSMGTWPRGAELTEVRGYGQRCRSGAPGTNPDDVLFTMDGPGVYRMALRHIPRMVRKLLDAHGLAPDDIDWMVPHQASGPGIAMLTRTGIPAERTVNIVDRYGNCVAAGAPMALAHLAASGRLERGHTVLLAGTGAGFSVALALLRW